MILAVVAVVALGGGGDGDDTRGANRRSEQAVPNTNVVLRAGEVTADSAGPPVTVSPEQSAAVIDTIGAYLEAATVKPLRSAQPAADLSAVFDPAALARATGVDRAAMVDEGLPKVTGDLDVVSTPVPITGLGDQDGNLVLVTAGIDARHHGQDRRPRSAPHRPARLLRALARPGRGVEGHVVQHCGHPRRRRPARTSTTTATGQ